MRAKNLGESDGLPLVEWTKVEGELTGLTQVPDTGGPNRHTTWLGTINEDGTPHITAVGAVWVDGAFFIQTGLHTRKAKNIARDPRCTLSVSTHGFDLTLDGEARRVTDMAVIAAIAEAWAAGGWPAVADESGPGVTAPFNAPGTGPPPWPVYRIEPKSATVVGTTDAGGATRFQF